MLRSCGPLLVLGLPYGLKVSDLFYTYTCRCPYYGDGAGGPFFSRDRIVLERSKATEKRPPLPPPPPLSRKPRWPLSLYTDFTLFLLPASVRL